MNGFALIFSGAALPQSHLLAAMSRLDGLAGCLILLGVLCQLLHRRMPQGLGASLFVAMVTSGAAVAAFHHQWPAPGEGFIASFTASNGSLIWAFFGWLASFRASDRAATDDPSAAPTFFAWSLVLGVAAAALIAYLLVVATWFRLFQPDVIHQSLRSQGLWHLLALFVATMFWRAAGAQRQQPFMLLLIAALMVWWTSLMIPDVPPSVLPARDFLARMRPAWWSWTIQMQAGLSFVLIAAVILLEWRYRKRRHLAWPDRLDELLEPYTAWPAYIQTESVIAAAILLVGVYHIVQGGPPHWQRFTVNAVCASGVGATCLFMAYRRWSPNTAGLGMAHVTLGAISVAAAVSAAMGFLSVRHEYTSRLPILYNAILFALGVMTPLWYWLSRFWQQQLLGDVAWTTTGRMIPYARRTGFLLTAMAALISFQMAVWPELREVPALDADSSVGRLVAGLSAVALLSWVAAIQARRSDSPAAATLAVLLLMAGVVFLVVRLPSARNWTSQYETVVIGIVAVPVLLAAEGLARTTWRSFSLPLWVLALLVIPARALTQLLVVDRPPAAWVRPTTFALLAVLYGLAGAREHRRTFWVLAAVLLLASLTEVFTE